MTKYEYKVLSGSPAGALLMPWASQEVRDEIGRGSFEMKMNALADEGWELVSASTTSVGGFLYRGTHATVFFRREKPASSTAAVD